MTVAKRQTQESKVLQWLVKNKTINKFEADKHGLCIRLKAVIYRLRKKSGLTITTNYRSRRVKNGYLKYVEYRLDGK